MRVRTVWLAGVVVALAACSGGSGPGRPATSRIVVGLINTENAPVGSFPELRLGAQLAQKYVDAHAGASGRRIEIVACTTNGTPESSQACANRLLARHPVAVIGGVDLGAPASLPPLQAAGIPYVGGTPAATDALTSRGSFMLAGGTATEVLGELGYAVHTLHATRIAVVYSDVPGLLSSAVGLLRNIADRLGVRTFKLFPVEQGAPDVVPALTAAAAVHPDAIIAVFPAQGCTRVVQGVAAIGLRVRMLYPGFCAVDSVLAAGGSSLDGSVFATGYLPYEDSGDPDVGVYLSALRSDPTQRPSILSQAGFSDVMIVARFLDRIAGTPTAATLSAALRSTRDEPGFMSHAFSCDGNQVPMLSSLCNAYVQISVAHDRRLEPTGGWTDTAPIAKLAIG